MDDEPGPRTTDEADTPASVESVPAPSIPSPDSVESPAVAMPSPDLDQAPGPPGPADEAAAVLSGDGLIRELPPGDEQEPLLRAFRDEEGAIVVEGAIASRFQRKEIVETLGEAFAGTRIEDRLEVDYDRIPVGWGNRVAMQFLVPFFMTVENGFVEYEQGIISLSGKASRRDADYFQHLAIDVFSGPYSRDIVNDIAP